MLNKKISKFSDFDQFIKSNPETAPFKVFIRKILCCNECSRDVQEAVLQMSQIIGDLGLCYLLAAMDYVESETSNFSSTQKKEVTQAINKNILKFTTPSKLSDESTSLLPNTTYYGILDRCPTSSSWSYFGQFIHTDSEEWYRTFTLPMLVFTASAIFENHPTFDRYYPWQTPLRDAEGRYMQISSRQVYIPLLWVSAEYEQITGDDGHHYWTKKEWEQYDPFWEQTLHSVIFWHHVMPSELITDNMVIENLNNIYTVLLQRRLEKIPSPEYFHIFQKDINDVPKKKTEDKQINKTEIPNIKKDNTEDIKPKNVEKKQTVAHSQRYANNPVKAARLAARKKYLSVRQESGVRFPDMSKIKDK